MPSLKSFLAKLIQETITVEKVFDFKAATAGTQSLIKIAYEDWLNTQNNYWLAVDKFYVMREHRQKLIDSGKRLIEEGAMSQSLSVKFMYNFFESQIFDVIHDDAILPVDGCA